MTCDRSYSAIGPPGSRAVGPMVSGVPGAWTSTPLCPSLGVRVPIVQAPMAGGPTTPALVAAVGGAGGLGVLGAGYQPPDEIRAGIRAVRARTSAPFGVNLFTPEPVEPDPAVVERVGRLIDRYRAEVGLPPAAPPGRVAEDFDAQLAVVVDERVPV